MANPQVRHSREELSGGQPCPSPPPDVESLGRPDVASRAYLSTIRQALPRLVGILGVSPWATSSPTLTSDASTASDGHSPTGRSGRGDHRLRSDAALALGMFCELEPTIEGKAYYRECVRASVICWQLSLCGEGRPIDVSSARPGTGCASTVAAIIELLSESARFQTPELIGDIGRHCHWLAGQPAGDARDQAATVLALIGGATLVRDTELLTLGRRRLDQLLAGQDAEGWFPEAGGELRLQRMPGMIQTLASIYARTRSEDLRDALTRAVEFLAQVSAPPFAPYRPSSGLEPIATGVHGYELLASANPAAAGLARCVRQQCSAPGVWSNTICSDSMVAKLCVAFIMAAEGPALHLRESGDGSAARRKTIHFSRGGVSVYDRPDYRAVVDVKRGGGLRVWWRSGAAPIEDRGLISISSGPCTQGGEPGRTLKLRQSDHACAATGEWFITDLPWPPGDEPTAAVGRYAIPSKNAVRGLARLGGYLRSLVRRLLRKRVLEDRFSRVILFRDGAIDVRDRIWCSRPILSVICQDHPLSPGGGIAPLVRRAPLYFAGGKRVRIDRTYASADASQQPRPLVTYKS